MTLINFLCNVAGADTQLLKRAPETDRWKVAALGSAVLCVAIVAWLSITAALIFVFQPAAESTYFQKSLTYLFYLVIGFIWLLVVFNLYRLAISANGYGDGTSDITNKELIDNLFKIVMGVFLAVCISVPINAVLLHKEIVSELNAMQEKKVEYIQKSVDESYRDDLSELYKSLANATIQYDQIASQSALNERKEVLLNEINTLRQNIAKRRFMADTEKAQKIAAFEKSQRLSLLDEAKQAFILHKAISLSVMIFTVILCLGPIFLRMVWVKGVYEYLCEFQDKLVLAKYGVHPEIEIFKNGEQVIQESYAVPELILNRIVNKLETEKNKSALELNAKYKKKQRQLKRQL